MGNKSVLAATIRDLKELVLALALGDEQYRYLTDAITIAGLSDESFLNVRNIQVLTKELRDRLGTEWIEG